jgi:hypothetical protein
MSKPSSIERFFLNAKGLFTLVAELVETAHKQGLKIVNPKLVNFAGIVLFNIDKKTVIDKFIERSYPHWDLIFKRDEGFFFENAGSVFVGLPLDRVNAFRELFILKMEDGELFISEDDREALWEYFESLVRISISFLQEDKTRNKYNIDIDKVTKIWNVSY